MKLKEWTTRLFDYSERLYAVRSDLLKNAESVNGYEERLHISLSIKAVDLIRIMLLFEYELLDTSHAIEDLYVSSYYARRVEILTMTKKQIGGHLEELETLRGRIFHPQVLDCIDQAVGVIGTSLRLLKDTIAFLENEIVSAGNDHTIH